MTTLQVRDVPESLSRELKSRAAAEGQSLSTFVREQLMLLVSKPTKAQLVEAILSREKVAVSDPVEELRRARETR